MSITSLDDFREKAIIDIAEKMILAAKTAPKGRGIERLHYLLLTGTEILDVSDKMNAISLKHQVTFFARDAGNLAKTVALVLIGSSIEPRNVPLCKHCGFGCDKKPETTPCAISQVDLGIAVGSAVSIAGQFHIDNRIMYSAGIAALELGLFPENIKIAYGIPLSASEKNIFFDR
ncbi:MAG: ferredoxin [Bacteroidetes bacterium HGW-Bacteroidetes-6]|jgi:uncharacterized ferredoxin-like protein|nr:MAG: ferredoxin [Bacteroidetes bacterium HGW-Bacteroidetes-6]